ncbi:hypothetical protein V6N12_013290 [Hibiscus sabdariffa]|uniref:Secreted protein n=1 Tax=Hibiscus sabdariffa TaxID=183260 RepID=A0ABR2D635_9ROSI
MLLRAGQHSLNGCFTHYWSTPMRRQQTMTTSCSMMFWWPLNSLAMLVCGENQRNATFDELRIFLLFSSTNNYHRSTHLDERSLMAMVGLSTVTMRPPPIGF